MFKYRVKFTKGQEVKLISHLDLLRAFNRIIKRAELPIAYSQGFNPHPLVTFSLPLPLGVISYTEFMDITLNTEISFEEVKDRLNKNAPKGIEILSVGEQIGEFTDIELAEYEIYIELKESFSDLDKLTNLFKGEVIMDKKSKRGVNAVDISNMVKKMEVSQKDANNIIIKAILDAGGKSNLKPDLFVQAFEKNIDGFILDYAEYKRINVMKNLV